MLMATHGVIQNPDLFQFALREVKYVGVWVTADSIKPTDIKLQAICSFKRPTNISEVRSWFGLVELLSFGFLRLL